VTVAVLALFGCRKKEPFEKVPLPPNRLEVVRLSETAGLSVERIRFWSEEMREARFFLALIPKASRQPAEVFILNHGWRDRPEYLLKYLKVDEVYETMLARGELRPAILVIPDVRFDNFYRVNSSRFPFPNYLTLVAEEVVGTVSRHYQIPLDRERWAIGGFSFGGYLSLDVGRRYPGRFSSVSVISGLVDPGWSFWPSQEPPSGKRDAQGRSRNTVIVPGPVPRLFLACGTSDRLIGGMRKLHENFQALGIPHEWSTASGGHTWQYWASVLDPMFRFALGAAQNPIPQ
jgi:enterochelin esterase-like enzyme